MRGAGVPFAFFITYLFYRAPCSAGALRAARKHGVVSYSWW